jgi:hypothetical protein
MIRFRTWLLLLAACALVTFAGAFTTPAPAAALVIADEGVIVCSCKLCAQNPYVECQIGPGDGYSILCADYYRINC